MQQPLEEIALPATARLLSSMGKNNQKSLEEDIAITKNSGAVSSAPAVKAQFQLMFLEADPVSPAMWSCLLPWSKPAFSSGPVTWGKEHQRYQSLTWCLHRGGEGNSPWKENWDRNSLSSIDGLSMASFLKQSFNKHTASHVPGSRTRRKGFHKDAVASQKSLFTLSRDSWNICSKLTGVTLPQLWSTTNWLF